MTPWRRFVRDLGWALELWRQAPGLPLLTLALAVATAAGSVWAPLGVVALPAAVFSVGFCGTQRLWYWRTMEGRPLAGAEVWRFTWRYFGRFFWLGIVAGVCALPVMAAAGVVAWALGAGVEVALVVACMAGTLAVDVAFTFVTPALALSTRSVGQAWDIGWYMLRDRWAEVKWHALVPPLVVVMGAQTAPEDALAPVAAAALGVVGAMLALWFKGAQVRAYLEEQPAPEEVSP